MRVDDDRSSVTGSFTFESAAEKNCRGRGLAGYGFRDNRNAGRSSLVESLMNWRWGREKLQLGSATLPSQSAPRPHHTTPPPRRPRRENLACVP